MEKMTQEDKELLLKDLCARLPYGVKCKVSYNSGVINDVDVTLYSMDKDGFLMFDEIGGDHREFLCKPYLFPLSSMTEEQWDKEFRGYGITEFTRDSFKCGCETLEFNNNNPNLSKTVKFINQLIKNHFDIYGLIPKGLAIDATGLNIY